VPATSYGREREFDNKAAILQYAMAMKHLSPLYAQANSIRYHDGNAKQFNGNPSYHNLVEGIPFSPDPVTDIKLSSCKKVGDGVDVVSEIDFKTACERVDDKEICCIVALVELSTLNYCNRDNKENNVAGKDAFTSNPTTPEIVAHLNNAPTSVLIQFLGEYVVHKCVRIWHTRKLDLLSFFICDEIYKAYAWEEILLDLVSVITRYGKRTAASLLRRKQFSKCRDLLRKSTQAASKRAVEKALDIVGNINIGVGNYVLSGGKSLLHCCLENTQFKYLPEKETACLIACSLHENLMMMHTLKNRKKKSIR